MSRNSNSNVNVKKPFCKVCHDTGKPESVYTSHFVKSMPDRSGKTTIVCPTLLSTECRYCFKSGHTTKFCPVLAKNEKERERLQRVTVREEMQKKNPLPSEKKQNTKFEALVFDSDSEDEEEQVSQVSKQTEIMEEFPVLGHVSNKSQPIKSGWAAIAAKTKEEKELEDYQNKLEEISMKRMLPQIAKKKIDVVLPKTYEKGSIYTMSWAEWSDSDSEDEDEPVFPEVNDNYKFNVKNTNVAVADW